MSPAILLLLNLISTWFLVGLIWLIQVIHYPQFADIAPDGFCAYHRRHVRAITRLVGPPMLMELGTSIGLLVARPNSVPLWVAVAGVVLVAMIWLSTAILQVPCHNRLARQFDERVHRRLCRSNWIRTILWTARGLLMLGAAGMVLSH